MRVADVAVVGVGLAMCGRSKDEYTESRKMEMSLFLRYFSKLALKSPSKTNVSFSTESFAQRFAR